MTQIKLDKHYVEPRLVEMYDLENPLGADSDFYLNLAEKIGAKTIVDVGCGTGLLTRKLASNGRKVFGIDPAAAMLAHARRQPHAERVTWIEGTAADLGEKHADLAIMTGNVAQVFLTDAAWDDTLKNIYAALAPGGYLAFESRHPAAKAWEKWNKAETFYTLDTPSGPVECWIDVIETADNLVQMQGFNRFLNSGEEIIVDSTLRFRSQAEITAALHQAGFTVENVFGDWHSGPVTADSKPLVFVARR